MYSVDRHQVPKEAVDAMAKAISRGCALDTVLADALTAWPGVDMWPTWRAGPSGDIFLPLPPAPTQESMGGENG